MFIVYKIRNRLIILLLSKHDETMLVEYYYSLLEYFFKLSKKNI